MLSFVRIFAPLVSCCSSPAKRPWLCEAASLHAEVKFNGSSLCLELSRLLSEVNLTPGAVLQQPEPDPPFPEDAFTVTEFEAAKYQQCWARSAGAQHLVEANLGYSYGGNTSSWSSGLLLPMWEDELPSAALPAFLSHSQLLLLISHYFCRSSDLSQEPAYVTDLTEN